MTTHKHSHGHTHPHPHADVHENDLIVRIQRLAMFLEAYFGEVELHMPDIPTKIPEGEEMEAEAPGLLIHLDESEAFINLSTMVSS